MAGDDKDKNKKANADGPQLESPTIQKVRLLKKHGARRSLHPDEIGVARIEFTVPASRLFGPNSLLGGGFSPDVIADRDPTDGAAIFDWDMGPNADPVIVLPGPGDAQPE